MMLGGSVAAASHDTPAKAGVLRSGALPGPQATGYQAQ